MPKETFGARCVKFLLFVSLGAPTGAWADTQTKLRIEVQSTDSDDAEVEPSRRNEVKEVPVEDLRPGCDNAYARKFFYHCRKRHDDSQATFMLLSLGWRGVLSERGNFSELLNFEAGVRHTFPRAVDIVFGAGSLFTEGGKANLDVHGRVFLLNADAGPYVGGGYVFSGKKQGFATLGLFGGSGLFFEFNFREGANKPVAALPLFGIRFVF